MKRAALLLTVFTLLGALSFACSEDPGSLNGEGSPTEPESTPLPNEKKSDTTSPPSTPSNTSPSAQADAGKPPLNTSGGSPTTNCAATTTKSECAKCCGGGATSPFKACACTAGSTCAGACAANLCADKIPDFACGLCLAQADCQSNGGGGDPGGVAQACIEASQCSAKP